MASSSFDYDLFVIGAGSGGVRAARIASSYGARVGIAEEHRVGGTCVIRGCVPKKLMVYAAHYREDFEDARGYGWTVEGEPRFDWQTLIANKDAEIDRLNGLYMQTLKKAGVAIHQARGVLADPHTVDLDGKPVTAETILIATGGTPNLPDIPGVEHAITSNEVFHLDDQPKRILIAGGGYIAVEFAGIFNGLGSETTLIYRKNKILRGFDEDLRDRLTQALTDQGVGLIVNQTITHIDKTNRGLTVSLTSGETLEVDQVMFAIGRRPNAIGLGLQKNGVDLAPNCAVIVDEYSQSNLKHIYAVGDVTDRVALTPVAIKEGHAFALSKYANQPTRADHRMVPSAVFSNPPIASVGVTEDEALSQLGQADIYVSDFRPMKHTLAGRSGRAFAKLVVDHRTQKVIGAHMIGPDAPEIIQGLAVAMRAGVTKAQLDATVAIHPTSAEEFVLMRQKRD